MREVKKKIARLLFRRCTWGDLPEVLEIERLSFRSPWPEAHFYEELSSPHSYPYVVEAEFADGSKKIVGYIFLWKFNEEGEIANIAVHPAFRRMKIGTSMLSMIEKIHGNKIKKLFLEVRVSNMPARLLYKKMGYEEVGIRKRYYTDNLEDAIVMMKKIEK